MSWQQYDYRPKPLPRPPRRKAWFLWPSVAGNVLALLVIIGLVVAFFNRQHEVSQQASTIHDQQTAISSQKTVVAQQQAALARQQAASTQQLSTIAAQRATMTTQATATKQQRVQVAKQQVRIVALQTQVAILRTSLTTGSAVSQPPLEPFLDNIWLVVGGPISLQPSTRQGYKTLSFRFSLENGTQHAVTVAVRHQVQVTALGPAGSYDLHTTPLPEGILPDIRVPPNDRLSYIASSPIPGNSTPAGFIITVSDNQGVGISFSNKPTAIPTAAVIP